jgi:hypothetical protein
MKQPHKAALINVKHLLNVCNANFGIHALALFRYQYEGNKLYQSFCSALGRNPDNVRSIDEIPFLPISFFKTHAVLTSPATAETADVIFESSGTTGMTNSKHYVWDKQVYTESLLSGFKTFYGSPHQYAILGLLPSYLERPNASLVYMAKTLISAGKVTESGFFINEWKRLYELLKKLEGEGRKTLLLGVTFALLDFAEQYQLPLTNTIIMETGGMKGRRQEITRAEVHDYLRIAFGHFAIHSEYGMTELLSQAYSLGNGLFTPTSTMKVLVRDVNDPLDVAFSGSGALNIIDLANVNSCSFIATEDLGTVYRNGTFTVMGRIDHSSLRGCSMLVV